MAAPLKPWERGGLNRQNDSFSPVNNSSLPPCCQPQAGGLSTQPAVASTNPPAVPPRPNGPSTGMGGNGGMGMYSGSMMSPYSMYGGGYGGYGGYGNYSGYGGYNSGYGGYGSYGQGGYGSMGYNGQVSSFARLADESSRPAFQSIESIVRAFTSVSMMLDSTFQAVYNSFRAVVGVADNFSRLKQHLAAVFGAMALFRTLRYLYQRLLELLGMKQQGEAARVWQEAVAKAAAGAEGGKPGGGRSSWPIIMFFAITMGGPWLFWRLMQALGGDTTGSGWVSGEEEHHVGQVLYNFRGQSDSELSVAVGQIINIAPKELQPRVRGWLLASGDGKTTGLVPANYIRIMGKRPGQRHAQQPLSSLSTSQSSPAIITPSLPNADDLLDAAPSLLPVSESESDLQMAFQEEVGGKVVPLPSQSSTQGGQCCKEKGVAQPAVGVAGDSCCSKKGGLAGSAEGQEVKDMTAADILDSQASSIRQQ